MIDAYAGGRGSTNGRLPGGLRFLDGRGPDISRSSAGRLAIERLWLPATLLPQAGVGWAAVSDQVVASFTVAGELVEMTLVPRHGSP